MLISGVSRSVLLRVRSSHCHVTICVFVLWFSLSYPLVRIGVFFVGEGLNLAVPVVNFRAGAGKGRREQVLETSPISPWMMQAAHLATCELRKCHDIWAAPRGLGVAQDPHESGESWLAKESTPVGFEPTRGNSIGLAGRRLDRSAKVSSDYSTPMCRGTVRVPLEAQLPT